MTACRATERSAVLMTDERGPALDDAAALEAQHDDRFDRRMLWRTGGPAHADQIVLRDELMQHDPGAAPSRVEELAIKRPAARPVGCPSSGL